MKTTCAELIGAGSESLSRAGFDNTRKEAALLLAHCLEMEYQELLLHLRETVSEKTARRYWSLVKRRSDREPLQYLTGRQEFMALEFEVNENVLVPRWDTERLVELVLEKTKEYHCPLVVDVGTGSGAIAVSLAKYHPDGIFRAVDISLSALELAKRNARRHGVENLITFVCGDLLSPFLDRGELFDIVVSNPPYIPDAEIAVLPADVQMEPLLALNGGPDGLGIYRKLIPQARRVLRPGGYLFLEIGWDQGEEVSSLCRVHGFAGVRVFPDYGGRDRVVSGYLPL